MDSGRLTSADIRAMWGTMQKYKIEKTTLTFEELKLQIRQNAATFGLEEPTEEGIRNAIAWMFGVGMIEFDETDGVVM